MEQGSRRVEQGSRIEEQGSRRQDQGRVGGRLEARRAGQRGAEALGTRAENQ